MPISFVSVADAAADTVTLPLFMAGDLAVVFAYRTATTAPSLPAGWTASAITSGNNNALRVAYRLLQAGDTTTGTWTNATHSEVLVLRGAATIGASATGTGAASTIIAGPTLTMTVSNGSSWVFIAGGHSAATDVNTVALTGTTTETIGTTAICIHTARNVSSWTNTTKTVNASGNRANASVEIIASSAASHSVLRGVLAGVHKGIM